MLSVNKFLLNPYLNFSLNLAKIKRKGFGNMFRHQVETFAILMDSGYTDSVLLNAAFIHDLVEELPAVKLNEISELDEDGKSVLNLVLEVSIRKNNGIEEPKKDFLLRIMNGGSNNAKVLKLADRISNVSSLSHADNKSFVERYIRETQLYVLPFAKGIDLGMGRELEEILNFIIKLNK
jgi:GTP pyrophosphokinase